MRRMGFVLALLGMAVPFAGHAETAGERRGKQVMDSVLAAMGGDHFLAMRNRVESGRAYSFYREQLSGLSLAKIYTRYLIRPEPPEVGFLGVRERQAFGKNEDNSILFTDGKGYEITFRGARPLPEEQLARFKDSTLHNIFYILRQRLGEPGLIFDSRGTDIFEAGNIRFGLEMRRQRNGDGGLAVHVLGDVGGSKGKSYVEETELLAFDCFWNGAHYHYGPRNKNHRINWDLTIIDDPLEWTFEQIENRKLGAMIERAGYPGIAADLDLDKIAAILPALKKRAFEMYEEGERLTGHKGLPLEFTPNLAAE